MPLFLPPKTIAAVLGLPLALIACSDAQKQAGPPPPPPPTVIVATPTKRMVVDYDEYVGRFVAVDAVEVRARVSGYLDKVHFKDGQIVKEGDLLFTIDRRPFQNALDQAKASLAQAKATLAYAEGDLARGEKLVRDKTITEQTFDQRTQAKRNAEASVAWNEMAVRQATLDLEFTELRAPVTGRIGDRRVSPGNLVTGGTQGNTTLLASIVSIDPIRFEFTFDEAAFLRYERLTKTGKAVDSRAATTEVMLKLIDEAKFTHQGRMDFVDNVIDRSTGTIRGRAQFANPDGVFIPGMFARVQVPSSSPYEALTIPDVAIGSEQTRKFVYVVGNDDVARQRYVTLGLIFEGMRVIKDGLSLEDRVVVNGLMQVRPGQKVTPQLEGAAASAADQNRPALKTN